MDECPSCGKWTMYYDPSEEKWKCFSCKHEIAESNESLHKRLLEQNKKGRYSILPPKE